MDKLMSERDEALQQVRVIANTLQHALYLPHLHLLYLPLSTPLYLPLSPTPNPDPDPDPDPNLNPNWEARSSEREASLLQTQVTRLESLSSPIPPIGSESDASVPESKELYERLSSAESTLRLKDKALDRAAMELQEARKESIESELEAERAKAREEDAKKELSDLEKELLLMRSQISGLEVDLEKASMLMETSATDLSIELAHELSEALNPKP